MKSILNKSWNRPVAVDLASCVIRLDYWLSKNEKCVDCKKGSGKKWPRDEWNFQAGKLYAYSYCLQQLGYVRFIHPWATIPNYIPIIKEAWGLSTGDSIRPFMEQTLYEDALLAMEPVLRADIKKYREENKYCKPVEPKKAFLEDYLKQQQKPQ